MTTGLYSVESSPASTFSTGSYAIYALPAELLLDIFATVNLKDSWTPLGYVYGHALARLASVCRYWYMLVISNPRFWRRIELVLPANTISLFLLRSGGCTLDVRIFYSRDTRDGQSVDDEKLSLVLMHSHRIRSLYVDTSLRDLSTILPRFVDAGLPLLEAMEVTRTRNGSCDFRSMPTRYPDYIDCGLAGKGQPRLWSLIGNYIRLPPVSQFWRNLRVMKLYNYPSTASGPLSMDDFMSMLRMNRALEELHILCSHVPSRPPLQRSDVAPPLVYRWPVVLPRLHVFILGGEFFLFYGLLLNFEIPRSVSYVDIRLSYNKEDEENILPAIQTFNSPFLLNRMSSVSLKGPYRTPSICSLPYAYADPDLPGSRHRISISLVHEAHHPLAPHHTVQTLIDFLGWSSVVRNLVLDTFDYQADALVERIFDAFPSVEELAVRGCCVPNILYALSEGRSGRQGADDGNMRGPLLHRWPQLRVLRVYAFCRNKYCEPRDVAEAVEACARSRAESCTRFAAVEMHVWVHHTEQGALREMEEEAAELVGRIARVVDKLSCTYGRSGLPWVPRVDTWS